MPWDDAEALDEGLSMLLAGLNLCRDAMRNDPDLDDEDRRELLQAARLLHEWVISKQVQKKKL